MRGLSRFTCEEAFRRIDDYLDRELSAEEMRLIEEHLETCAACTREFNFEASVLRQVRSKLERVVVPSDLLGRILSIIEEAQPEEDEDPPAP